MTTEATPREVGSNLGLGPLPPCARTVVYNESKGYSFDAYTVHQMLDYARAAVVAERERCAAIARRWGETHADGVTVNARNAASKIARGIEGPNVELTGLRRAEER